MNKCNQSEAEKLWLEDAGLYGYDKLSGNRSFGLIKDKEGCVFSHIPDAVLINKHTLDIYILDHKTCPLNGTMCKRTADANKFKQELRGNKGYSFMASWSNSFYQKDLIQRAFRSMAIGGVYYIIVTKRPVEMKKSWKKKNPFVLNLTEEEVLLLKEDAREIEVFDKKLSSHQMDGFGGLIVDLPEVNNKQSKFKAVAASGLVTIKASELVRPDIELLGARLII